MMTPGVPVSLVRRELLAAARDPEPLLRALATPAHAALVDALLSLTTVTSVPMGGQVLEDPFLSGSLHALTLRGLVALAPPESVHGERLRTQLQALTLQGAADVLTPTSLRYLDHLPGVQRLFLLSIHPLDTDTLAAHPGLDGLTGWRCHLPPESVEALAGASIRRLFLEGSHPLGAPVTHLPGLDLLRDLEVLDLHHLPSLTHLPDLSVHGALVRLNLQGLSALTSAPQLPTGLVSLTLSGLPWTQKALTAALCELSAVNELDVEGLAVSDLSWLPEAPLHALRVRAAPSLTSLRGIERLAQLTFLDLSGCDALVDLTPLSGLSGLVRLDLRGCRAITDLGPLLALPALRAVAIAGCGAERSLPAVLRRRVVREWSVHWSPRAPARRAPDGDPSLTPAQRAALRTVRALLHSGDTPQVDQAIELVRALDDPGVYAPLLQGVTLAVTEGEDLPSLQPGRLLSGRSTDRSRLRWALLQILANAPPEVPEAMALRGETTALLADQPVMDAAALGTFSALRRLELRGVRRLDHPEALSRLTTLASLQLTRCALPEGVRLPPSVVQLEIEHLTHPSLALLDGISTLEVLSLEDAPSLLSLSGLEGAHRLRQIHVARAPSLADLSGLRGLLGLEWLSLRGELAISDLDGLGAHPCLRGVVLRTPSLTSIRGLRGCVALESLTLRDCPGVESLAGLEDAQHLRHLDLSGCSRLTDLSPVQGASLLEVALRGCAALRSLAGLSGSPHLSRLVLSHVSSLSGVWGLEGAAMLESLEIERAPVLSSLSALAGLPRLQRLTLRACPALLDLSVVSMLPALSVLTLSDVPRGLSLAPLARVPDGLALHLEAPLDLAPLQQAPQVAQVRLARRHFDPAGVPLDLLSRVCWVD